MYLKIPFNVWDVCGEKGLIPVKVELHGNVFECKLIPKGGGMYYIPVSKGIYKNIDTSEEIEVSFKVIDGLKRINCNSPYSKEKPIRIINDIDFLEQPQSGLCCQTCIAMLAGISVKESIEVMKSSRWQASMGKVMETMDYFGITYENPVYTKGRKVKFPKCCIINVRGEPKNHLTIYYEDKYYDPTCGVLDDYKFENIICYIEIRV